MGDERFYSLRAKSYDELVLQLNQLPDSDFVLYIAQDKVLRYNDHPTIIAIIERGEPDVSSKLQGIMQSVNSA